jgi:hypothetical protein
MSDTVSASVIVASLSSSGPSFTVAPAAPAADSPAAQDASALHVSGGANTPVSGSGPSLLVDFVTWVPVPAANALPPTVPGLGAGSITQDAAPAVAGGVHLTFHQIP